MSEHTPGKLMLEEVVSDSGHIKHLCPVEVDGLSLLTVVEHDGVKFAAVYSDDDARRLVACWNACDGISTETLELVPQFTEAGIKTVQSVEAERDSLRAVNAELLGALRMLLATAGEINEAPDSLLEMALDSDDQETRNQANAHLCARAAIASARKLKGEEA